MLHHRHDLDSVVPGTHDARQNIFAEIRRSTDTQLVLGHADMRLVDQRYALGVNDGTRQTYGGGSQTLRGKEQCVRVLDDPSRISRNAFAASTLHAISNR